jgi:branched-chain amino acid transport system ATP-binding protein
MFEFRNVEARYRGFTALHDITLSVGPGERLAVFGHNGAGKTTLLRCGIGDVDDLSGSITYNSEAIVAGSVYRNARRGIGFVAQGHNVFRDLSVAQNLKIAGLLHDQSYTSEIYRLFPLLLERRTQIAGSLSGGQQQMLAVGMALMTRPTILMLDEPTTGLAPIIVQDMFRTLLDINRGTGTAIVLVEQNVAAALRIAERAIVLKAGRIIFDGPSAELVRQDDLWRWF